MAKWFFKPHRGSLIDSMKDTVEGWSLDSVLDKVAEWMQPCDKSVCRQDIYVCGERMNDDRCGIKLMFRVELSHHPTQGYADHVEKACIGHIFCEEDYDIEKWNLYMKGCNEHVDNS